jgi:hypothetical protein
VELTPDRKYPGHTLPVQSIHWDCTILSGISDLQHNFLRRNHYPSILYSYMPVLELGLGQVLAVEVGVDIHNALCRHSSPHHTSDLGRHKHMSRLNMNKA